MVNGLAWTETGGELLHIEALGIEGKGALITTGQLGDVMKESAQIAYSYVRAQAEKLKIEPHVFDNREVHLHVPAGAIPKDGPSAGIAMTMALASLFSNRAVRSDVGMTGEITLRGRVLPIGGLKEKALGALRGGIRRIIFPEKNKKDLAEIPRNLKRKIEFIPVKSMEQVLEKALLK